MFYNNINCKRGHQMIELLFVLIILEIVIGIYMIMFMEKKIRLIEEVNKNLVKSGFSGNLTEFKMNLKILNVRLRAILAERVAQEKVEKVEKVAGLLNSVLLGFSFFKFLGKRKDKKFSKHK